MSTSALGGGKEESFASHSIPYRNELERVYLVNIHYNINVSSSMYAKYYFDLRVLAEENGLSFPNEFLPLTKERAKKLEVCIPMHLHSSFWSVFNLG